MERQIELSSRNENTRSPLVPNMHLPKLDEMLEQATINIQSIKDKFRVAGRLLDIGNDEGAKDIYRSQIVFLESALDFYLHSLSIYAMEQMYLGNWDKTDGYKNLRVPIDKVIYAINHPEETAWMDHVIVSYHETKTYMHPKEIKGLFTLIIGKDFFDKAAKEMYYNRDSRVRPEDKLKKTLKDLFDRRNKIVHQADRNHTTGELYDIQEGYVSSSIDNVQLFITTINNLLTQ